MNDVITSVIELVDTHKAKLAFLAPLILALGATTASWAVSGQFDATEIRAAVGGTILAISSGAAAYLAPAGRARVDARAVDHEQQAARGEHGALN